jgi:hypothetical protein
VTSKTLESNLIAVCRKIAFRRRLGLELTSLGKVFFLEIVMLSFQTPTKIIVLCGLQAAIAETKKAILLL